MSKKERTQEEKELARRMIIDAAEKLIDREGFSNFSIRNLAKEMNYSTGIIYGNYENKNEILFEVIRKKFSIWNEKVQELHLETIAPQEALFMMLKEAVKFHLSQGEISREIIITLVTNRLSYQVLTKDMLYYSGILQTTLQRCLREDYTEEDVLLRYSYLSIAIQGLVLKLISGGEKENEEQYIDGYIRCVLHALLND